MYSNLSSLYLKLHVVHEIIVSYMAPFLGANISSKILSHQKKKKKKYIAMYLESTFFFKGKKKKLKLNMCRKIIQ